MIVKYSTESATNLYIDLLSCKTTFVTNVADSEQLANES